MALNPQACEIDYRSTVGLHLRPGSGHHRLDRLQPEHLGRLYGSLLDKGLSPRPLPGPTQRSCWSPATPTGVVVCPLGDPLPGAWIDLLGRALVLQP